MRGICPVCGEYTILDFGIFGAHGQNEHEPCCEECFDGFHRAFEEARKQFTYEFARDYIKNKQQERYAAIDQERFESSLRNKQTCPDCGYVVCDCADQRYFEMQEYRMRYGD